MAIDYEKLGKRISKHRTDKDWTQSKLADEVQSTRKHISLIETGTLVIGVATMPELFEKTMSNVKEVKARGADVLGVTVEGFEAEIGKYADYAIVVPKVHPMLQPSLALIPMQIFAYYMALQRGCDVDKPRNLAKSVTVE